MKEARKSPTVASRAGRGRQRRQRHPSNAIMVRRVAENHAARVDLDREGIVAQLREFGLLAARKVDPKEAERQELADYSAKRAEAVKRGGAVLG